MVALPDPGLEMPGDMGIAADPGGEIPRAMGSATDPEAVPTAPDTSLDIDGGVPEPRAAGDIGYTSLGGELARTLIGRTLLSMLPLGVLCDEIEDTRSTADDDTKVVAFATCAGCSCGCLGKLEETARSVVTARTGERLGEAVSLAGTPLMVRGVFDKLPVSSRLGGAVSSLTFPA
mmetsp:Transcript_54203/g.99127  ORF Transcript_54203/g.99127 Transcript_54203/m.99127 type:complete len:176 (+) Transcript_54203:1-528(+)